MMTMWCQQPSLASYLLALKAACAARILAMLTQRPWLGNARSPASESAMHWQLATVDLTTWNGGYSKTDLRVVYVAQGFVPPLWC